MKERQRFLNDKNLFFELKEIAIENSAQSFALLFNNDISDNLAVRYLQEMGLKKQEYDLSGVSYDRSATELLLNSLQGNDCQLQVVVGDGVLVNTIKYAKHCGLLNDAPIIYIPTMIEAGDEANCHIVFFDNKQAITIEDENAFVEYVLYDPESICVTDEYRTNACIANAIARAVFILWTNDANSEAAVLAGSGFKTLTNLITKVQRGERASFCDALKASANIGAAFELSENQSAFFPALILSSVCDMHPGQAMIKMVTALCLEVENYLISKGIVTMPTDYSVDTDTKIDGKTDGLYERAINIAKFLAPKVLNIHGISEQTAFFEFALNMHDRNLEKDDILNLDMLSDESLFDEWPIKIGRDDIRRILLHTFHKEELGRALECYELNVKTGVRPKRSAAKIDELKSKYKNDLSYGRIIEEPAFEDRRKRQLMVKGLQREVLETLLLSKTFLEKEGLRYYLSEGTLLGAVRHRGFIPWDDDVDIMMPREDYNKLVELDKNGLIPPELHFDALENNPKHWVLGAKLQLTRKSKYTQTKVKGLSKFNGPYVDVFPLDYWNSPYSKKQYKAQRMVKMCRRLLFMKTGYSKVTKGKWHRILMRIAVHFIPNTMIEKFAIRNMTKFNNGNRKYMVHLTSYYRYYKEVFPTSCYGEPVYMEFEGHDFPVPKEYDYMLKTIYGTNYDSLPPAWVANMRNHPFDVDDSE